MYDILKNLLYLLDPKFNLLVNSKMFRVEGSKNNSLNDDTYMWHLRLGHIDLDRIQRLEKDGSFRELKC